MRGEEALALKELEKMRRDKRAGTQDMQAGEAGDQQSQAVGLGGPFAKFVHWVWKEGERMGGRWAENNTLSFLSSSRPLSLPLFCASAVTYLG